MDARVSDGIRGRGSDGGGAESSPYWHRDATMILTAYRHGLRASEVCGLQWHQVELAAGRLHVRRSKRGISSVHPCPSRSLRLEASQQGHDTRALQAWLGHRNIRHTMRYTELVPNRFKDFWRE